MTCVVECLIQFYNDYMYTILFLNMYVYHCTVAYMSTIGTVHTDYKMGPAILYV